MHDRLFNHLQAALLAINDVRRDKGLDQLNDAARALNDAIEMLFAPAKESSANDTSSIEPRIPKPKEEKRPIVIDYVQELDIATARPLLRQLLDLLPVQIFIKDVHSTPGKGRKYLYMNDAARQKASPAPLEFDGDAFLGGMKNPEWAKMFAAETKTLERTRAEPPLEHSLEWTNPEGEWRKNHTIECPVFLGDVGGPIAFCSIAEDIFMTRSDEAYRRLARSMLHEFGNMSTSIDSHIKVAIDSIDKNKQKTAFISLQIAKKEAEQAKERGQLLWDAISPDAREATATIEEIAHRMKHFFDGPAVHINVMYDGIDPGQTASSPKATSAILIELFRNAEKHSAGTGARIEGTKFLWHRIVHLRISRPSDKLIAWTVSNELRSDETFGRPSPESGKLGVVMIQRIARERFKLEYEQLIDFPRERPADGWIHVTARIPQET